MSWTDRPSRAGQRGPALPVVLGQAVLDGDDRVPLDPAGQEVDHAGGVELPAAVGSQAVSPARRVEEMAGGDIHGDRDVAPRLEAAGNHRIDDDLEGLLVAVEPGTITPLVADQGRFEVPFFRARRRWPGRARPSSRGLRCSWTHRPG